MSQFPRSLTTALLMLIVSSAVSIQVFAGQLADSDVDGVDDLIDNCTLVPNPAQVDTDADGFGNACDGDFNNDLIVNFQDFALFPDQFLSMNALFDLNNDGVVNFGDFAILTGYFLQPPGPAAPLNNLPTAESGTYSTSDAANLEGAVLVNDLDGDPVQVSVLTPPLKGEFVEFADDGTFTYVPFEGVDGIDVFSVVVSDPFGASEPIEQTIEIFKWPTAIRIGGVGDDRGGLIFHDLDGNLVIAGRTANSITGAPGTGSLHKFVRKYDRRGNPVWTIPIGDPAVGGIRSLMPVPDSDDFIVLNTSGGASVLSRHQKDGTELWSELVEFQYSSVLISAEWATVDDEGNVFLVSTRLIPNPEGGSSLQVPVFSKISGLDGSLVWQTSDSPLDANENFPLMTGYRVLRLRDVFLNSAGELVSLGNRISQDFEAVPAMITLSPSGDVVGATVPAIPVTECGLSVEVARSQGAEDGSIYVQGRVNQVFPSETAAVFSSRVSSDGTQNLFHNCEYFDAIDANAFEEPLILDDGSVINSIGVTKELLIDGINYERDQLVLIKYSAQGDVLWSQFPENGEGLSGDPGSALNGGVIQDSQGLLYMTGAVYGELEGTVGAGFDFDIFILRMDSDGNRK